MFGCIALLVAGCGDGASSTRADVRAPASTVRIALREQPNTLDPLLVTQFYENYIAEAIFSGLTMIDDRGRPIPDLAVAVPTFANGGISRDGRTLTYRLRPNARWQDGVPVTADDVVFTFEKMRDPRVPFPSLAQYATVESVRAADAHTVVVRLRKASADATAEIFVNGQNGGIVPRHLLGHETEIGRSRFDGAPIGSGPYRVERWERGASITLRANRDYFGGPPAIDRIVATFVPDGTTRALQARTGETDLTMVPTNSVRELRGLPQVRVQPVTAPTLMWVLFRSDAPPFDDQRVRRAFALAVDRQSIVHKVLLGFAQPADDYVVPDSPFHHGDPSLKRPQMSRAMALLDEAGWHPSADGPRFRRGTRLAVTLTTVSGYPELAQTAVQLQDAWREIGAAVTIRNVAANQLYAPDGIAARGNFSVIVNLVGFATTPDRSQWFERGARPPNGYNYARLADAELDRWIEAAHASSDVTQRRRLYARISDRVRASADYVPIAWLEMPYAIASRLQGVRPEPVNSDLWNVTQWRLRSAP